MAELLTAGDEIVRWGRESVVVRRLDDVRVIDVQGEDARSWLNGQTTADVREVGEDASVYALSVNVKGRAQADLWAVAQGAENMAFVAPVAALDQLLGALDRHIIMEDVELSTRHETVVVTVQGPKAAELADALPTGTHRVATTRFGAGGFDIWLERDDADRVCRDLAAAALALGGGEADATEWARANVAAGIPRFAIDFGGDTYPQEAGLLARAVSFNKGCYLGQEVVCMLENRGKVAKRLVQLVGPAGAVASEGDTCQDGAGGRVGNITSVRADETTPLALALLKGANHEPGAEIKVGEATWTVTARAGGDD